MLRLRHIYFCAVVGLSLTLNASARAADLKILLPQGRTVFQTNEWIDVSVVRSSAEALAAGSLNLTLNGKDGSKVSATFPTPAVALNGKEARATEHYHFNGWLLRPGTYTVEAVADGATTTADIEVYSHIRQSSFKLINWGRAKSKEQLTLGEDSLGYNIFYGSYTKDEEGHLMRAGVDFISNCTMGGAHQMDIRSECDWSDPLVTRGGTVRVVRRAMMDRTRPNVLGVHFYDEPGLTWVKNAETGEVTPHMIPSQVKSYVGAFGKQPLSYHKVDPKNPENVAQWTQWAKWKLGFMEAAWKEAQFGVSQVRPDYLSVTQSQYGWSAFTDGYYFNIARNLPVTSGHGGYDDYGPGFFNPSFTLEMARARDFAKPCWYLPTWYGNTPSDRMRLEQYLSFQTGIQGIMTAPDQEPATNPAIRQGIVESNQLMKKLGTIFHTMPPTKPPVALLFSLSQAIHTQTKNMQANYLHSIPHGQNLPLTYLAGKLQQQQFLAVVEEDVLDGTLANDHKAVILTSIDYLDPQVIAALETYITGGGTVLLTGDCTVQIKGAIKLSVAAKMPDQDAIDKLMEAKKYNELGSYTTTAKHFEGALPLAKAIKTELDKLGIKPIIESDSPTVIATRQAAGDIEYVFAVNAATDGTAKNEKGQLEKNAVIAGSATLGLPGDGRPVYDALTGGTAAEFQPKDGKLVGQFRFGPGEMRVFARTARPIAGVRATTPILNRELTLEQSPLRLDIGAALVDGAGRVLSGSAPLHIRVIDPLGVTRYDLYRATQLGQFTMSLPLAANDPAGQWKVVISELLANTEDTVTFNYAPPKSARAIAGASPRAVYAVNDRDNAFRFARLHQDVTIVKGNSAFNEAAAQRLTEILKPWGVRCKTMDLKDAAKPRTLTEEEARTWIGLNASRCKPGDANPPTVVGFAVQGPAILLGNPEDHPIIKHLATEKFLPYAPNATTFPGTSRGLLAWQRDGVGHGQESITLIAYDEPGMAEAIGSFYEAVAGLEPLTKWNLPQKDVLAPAKTAPGKVPEAIVVWSVRLPDRVVGLKTNSEGLIALTHDGSLSTVNNQGKLGSTKALTATEVETTRKEIANGAVTPEVAKAQARADRLLKLVATDSGKTAVAYWGGTLRIVDSTGNVIAEQQLPQDITALAWLDGKLVAGLADGRVCALAIKK